MIRIRRRAMQMNFVVKIRAYVALQWNFTDGISATKIIAKFHI